jgi:hypothetical protein
MSTVYCEKENKLIGCVYPQDAEKYRLKHRCVQKELTNQNKNSYNIYRGEIKDGRFTVKRYRRKDYNLEDVYVCDVPYKTIVHLLIESSNKTEIWRWIGNSCWFDATLVNLLAFPNTGFTRKLLDYKGDDELHRYMMKIYNYYYESLSDNKEIKICSNIREFFIAECKKLKIVGCEKYTDESKNLFGTDLRGTRYGRVGTVLEILLKKYNYVYRKHKTHNIIPNLAEYEFELNGNILSRIRLSDRSFLDTIIDENTKVTVSSLINNQTNIDNKENLYKIYQLSFMNDDPKIETPIIRTSTLNGTDLTLIIDVIEVVFQFAPGESDFSEFINNQRLIIYPTMITVSIGELTTDVPYELKNIGDNSYNYKLKSVILKSPGHYTSLVKYSNKWYYIDIYGSNEVSHQTPEQVNERIRSEGNYAFYYRTK